MSKYLEIYETLCPDDPIEPDDPRRGPILAEMRAIVHAPDEAAVLEAIRGWGWPNPQGHAAHEFVREARRLAREQRTASHASGPAPRRAGG